MMGFEINHAISVLLYFKVYRSDYVFFFMKNVKMHRQFLKSQQYWIILIDKLPVVGLKLNICNFYTRMNSFE